MNGEGTETGSDAFATLLWGLRRYALLVIALVVALGVLVPVMLGQRAVTYQATAQVGPTAKLELPNADPLPRIAESIFNNGAVENAIRAEFNRPQGNVIPSRVQLIAAQDNLVLEVVARAPSAQEAIALANAAATTFVVQLNYYKGSVASFSIQHRAELAKKVPKLGGGSASLALGLLAGLLAGVAVVGLILVIRRPVVEPSSASDVTGRPVIGRLGLPRNGPPSAADDRSIALLCRRLLSVSPSTIQVAAPQHAQAEQLADLMKNAMRQNWETQRPPQRPQQKRSGGQGGKSSIPRVVAPQDAQSWICVPDESYTVLMAPVGISARKLRLFAEGHNTGAPTGVVLVTTHRRAFKTSGKPLSVKG